MLKHLESAWEVDRSILCEEERLVVIRFGQDHDKECIKMDEVLYKIEHQVSRFAVIYLVDNKQVPEFNTMYELYDPCTVMFFFRWVEWTNW
jgi:DIM1 family U5 snRNP protein